MKKRDKCARILKTFMSAIAIVLAAASHAFANNGPAPAGMALVLLLAILIVALTLAGGGSGIMNRLMLVKYPSKTRRTLANFMEFVAAVFFFFLGIMIFPIIGVAGFSIYAIARGVKMIRWGREAGKNQPRPAHLEGVSPKRLKAAGIMLIILTLIVAGYSVINIDEVTGIGDGRKWGYAHALNTNAKTAHVAAMAFLLDNPKAAAVTCADMEKAGYKSSYKEIACFSDMTASSGGIRLTGPESWGLKKPVAVITYSGELTGAQP